MLNGVPRRFLTLLIAAAMLALVLHTHEPPKVFETVLVAHAGTCPACAILGSGLDTPAPPAVMAGPAAHFSSPLSPDVSSAQLSGQPQFLALRGPPERDALIF
jgi:hypothetical protein